MDSPSLNIFDIPSTELFVAAKSTGGFVFRDESILGTRMNIIIVADDGVLATAAAIAAREEIDRLAAIFNTREPNSELSRLNANRSTATLSEDLFYLLQASEYWQSKTFGYFSGRLGKLINLLQHRGDFDTDSIAKQIASASVAFDSNTRRVIFPGIVEFALEGFAKGWIVDRAYDVIRTFPGIDGALVEIGGDLRCGGRPPENNYWDVFLPDATCFADNAPARTHLKIKQGGIATSGIGVRDTIRNDQRFSHTLDPHDGKPVKHHLAATVIADTAADADALASAILSAPTTIAQQLAQKFQIDATITLQNKSVITTQHFSDVAQYRQIETEPTDRSLNIANAEGSDSETPWPKNWQALATFTAPRRQLLRDPYFRSPYMAMWITDKNNTPVRTLILVGKFAPWQKDNFIWWSMHRGYNEELIAIRSMSTSGAGVYNVFWDGLNDDGEQMPADEYVLHVETSRERGKHTYRSLVLDFRVGERFIKELEATEEGGGLRVSFDHY